MCRHELNDRSFFQVMDLLSVDANEETIRDLISNGRVSDTVRALAEDCMSKASAMMDTS